MSDLVKLAAPAGASTVGWMGNEYKVVRGFVRIEAEAVEHLVAHGFGVLAGKKDETQDDDQSGNDGNVDGKNDGNPDGGTGNQDGNQ